MQRCGFASKGLFRDGRQQALGAWQCFSAALGRPSAWCSLTRCSANPARRGGGRAGARAGPLQAQHITKRMAWMFAASLGALRCWGGWPVGRASIRPWRAAQPRRAERRAGAAALLMVVPVFGFFVTPIFAQLSRRDEFQADAFACTHARSQDLRSALLKLHEDNAGTLTPRPRLRQLLLLAPRLLSAWAPAWSDRRSHGMTTDLLLARCTPGAASSKAAPRRSPGPAARLGA